MKIKNNFEKVKNIVLIKNFPLEKKTYSKEAVDKGVTVSGNNVKS